MEITRKKISDAEITEKEKELLSEAYDIISEYEPFFSVLGYELECTESFSNEELLIRDAELEFLPEDYKCGYVSSLTVKVKRFRTDSDDKEDEERFDAHIASAEESGAFTGRGIFRGNADASDDEAEAEEAPVSGFKRPVKLFGTHAGEDDDGEAGENVAVSEEQTQLADDVTLEDSEEELMRTIAVSSVMLARIYKVFWTEKVSIPDSASLLRSDLTEFLDRLSGLEDEGNDTDGDKNDD